MVTFTFKALHPNLNFNNFFKPIFHKLNKLFIVSGHVINVQLGFDDKTIEDSLVIVKKDFYVTDIFPALQQTARQVTLPINALRMELRVAFLLVCSRFD